MSTPRAPGSERPEDLPPDILARLRADFGDAAAPTLFDTLTRAIPPDLPNGSWARHLRCVIHLAGGDRDGLDEAIELCRTDARDAMVGAEYVVDGPGPWNLRRVRDFDRPFDSEADGLAPP